MSREPTTTVLRAPRSNAPGIRALVLAAAALALAGCNTDQLASGPLGTDDYHQRHPILLTNAPSTLEVYPVGIGGLDSDSVRAVKQFAARYKELGAGRLVILAPSNGYSRVRPAVDDIRRVLASTGLRGSIGLGSYPVADGSIASPILVKFLGVKAEVPSRCGDWPDDLASGGSTQGWNNAPYWNFGCATQSVLAAQVDDPRDFQRARALGPADEEMRLRAIKDVRDGQDPGTNWKVQLTPIGQVGGN